ARRQPAGGHRQDPVPARGLRSPALSGPAQRGRDPPRQDAARHRAVRHRGGAGGEEGAGGEGHSGRRRLVVHAPSGSGRVRQAPSGSTSSHSSALAGPCPRPARSVLTPALAHAARPNTPRAKAGPLIGAVLVRRMVALLALVALLAVNLRWAEPYYDWDLLGYSGVAARIGGATPAEAHRRVYDLAYRNVPPEQYAWLVEGGEFQQAVAADPAAFEQQLPFYRLEPAYPLLILALDRLGVDPVHGSVWISRVAYLGIGVVAFVWLSGFLSPLAALATAWGAMSVQVALEAARLPTPDAFSALVVLTALWLVFECQHFG